MDQKIALALRGLISGISCAEKGQLEGNLQPSGDLIAFYDELQEVFNRSDEFLVKLKAFDQLFEKYEKYQLQQEMIYDLLLINFFAQDADGFGDDYLESEGWEAIEDKTIDRGTELLNILLYLRECQENKIQPSLDDFLKEFLLVEEEEFQDEYNVYEEVIAGQLLVEASYEQIAEAAAKVEQDAEIKQLFYPLMSFFYETDPEPGHLSEFFRQSRHPLFDCPALFAILAYHGTRL